MEIELSGVLIWLSPLIARTQGDALDFRKFRVHPCTISRSVGGFNDCILRQGLGQICSVITELNGSLVSRLI